ncbi:MAG: hypothetical protein KBG07_07220, partial [Elusimicrobia bacterium]|nr:hypothetical protein [Elusimicrobiota bacterium]
MSKKLKNKSALAGKNVATVLGPEFGSAPRFWMAVSLVLVGFLLYKNTLHAPFVLDDVHKIQNNTDLRIEKLSQVFSKLVYPYSQNKSFVRNDPSRPVTFLTLTLNYYFGKLDPFGYRLGNLLGHGFVGVLLFLLTRRLFFLLFGNENVALSFVLALLFVVHPVNAIVALYPFNRSDILAALTSLGALLLFFSASPPPRWKHRAALGLFIL